jgi:hypothetical protein
VILSILYISDDCSVDCASSYLIVGKDIETLHFAGLLQVEIEFMRCRVRPGVEMLEM